MGVPIRIFWGYCCCGFH